MPCGDSGFSKKSGKVTWYGIPERFNPVSDQVGTLQTMRDIMYPFTTLKRCPPVMQTSGDGSVSGSEPVSLHCGH